jgi:hypothetical protein
MACCEAGNTRRRYPVTYTAPLLAGIIIFLFVAGCTTPAPQTSSINTTETSITFMPTPAATPTVMIRQIPVSTPVPAPIVVSMTSDHVSKYADYNPALSYTPMGTALVSTPGLNVRADIYINSTDDNSTVNLPVNVTMDGSSTSVPLIPGNYIATLPDKYDNRTEDHTFLIIANSMTYVAFNGYSYRQSAASGGCK